jgi:hypothetical protein
MLKWGIEEALDLREGKNFIELPVDLCFPHSQNGALIYTFSRLVSSV